MNSTVDSSKSQTIKSIYRKIQTRNEKKTEWTRGKRQISFSFKCQRSFLWNDFSSCLLVCLSFQFGPLFRRINSSLFQMWQIHFVYLVCNSVRLNCVDHFPFLVSDEMLERASNKWCLYAVRNAWAAACWCDKMIIIIIEREKE